MKIPQFLLEFGSQSKSHEAWVDSLPVLIQQAVTKWNLQVGFPFMENATCSFVAPCTMAGKKNVVLKIGYPHFEATYEIEGLKRLNGKSVVRIIAADESVNSMLLERCRRLRTGQKREYQFPLGKTAAEQFYFLCAHRIRVPFVGKMDVTSRPVLVA